jgi:thioredoxin 1
MNMAHMDLTNKNFDSIIGNGVTLVDFWADWCGPCKMQAPVIDELGEKYEGKVTVAKLNVDDEPSIAARFGVMSIPTLIVYREGEEVTRRVGVQSLDQLEVMLGVN